ncbi:MAG: hypothetical protein ACLP0J_20100 [Solirubrobacteraceae bacterium]|jgi:hypothetical protein
MRAHRAPFPVKLAAAAPVDIRSFFRCLRLACASFGRAGGGLVCKFPRTSGYVVWF